MLRPRLIRGYCGAASGGSCRPVGGAAPDLLEGTGIWDSEDDWTLLEGTLAIAGGALTLDDTTNGTYVGRWAGNTSLLVPTQQYTVTWTWTNPAVAAPGGVTLQFNLGTFIQPTHTTGSADYLITAGATTSIPIDIRLNVPNSLQAGRLANGVVLEIRDA